MDTTSKSLGSAVNNRYLEKRDAAKKKYADRGTSGEAAYIAERNKLLGKAAKSDKSIDRYGKDAPKARSFMSEDRPKKMAKGGMVGRGDGCCMKGKTKGAMR